MTISDCILKPQHGLPKIIPETRFNDQQVYPEREEVVADEVGVIGGWWGSGYLVRQEIMRIQVILAQMP